MNQMPNYVDRPRELPKKEHIFVQIGAICALINDLAENPEDMRLINRLKTFLSIMSLPFQYVSQIDTNFPFDQFEQVLAQYFEDSSNSEVISEILSEDMKEFRRVMSMLMYYTRANPLITWVDYEDPLIRESLLNNDIKKIDTDTISELSIYKRNFYIRRVMPHPDAFWKCNEIYKLIHFALIMMEELIHITQESTVSGAAEEFLTKLHMGSIGLDMEMSEEDSESALRILIDRMCETDVTNILTRLVPRMVTEDWQWYTDRTTKETTDVHYPVPFEYMWLMGAVLAEVTGQKPIYILDTMLSLSESIDGDPNRLIRFFSNEYIIPSFNIYMRLLLDETPNFEPDQLEGIKHLRKQEFGKVSALELFIQYLLFLREMYGTEWEKHILRDGHSEYLTEEQKEGIADLAITNITLIERFFYQNPSRLFSLFDKYGIKLRTKLVPMRLKDIEDILNFASKYIRVLQLEA